MSPWGALGWVFPPAQASRIVGFAPEVAHLTMPLQVSSMHFGIAFGSFAGGQLIAMAPVSALGLLGSVFAVSALAVLILSEARARRRILPEIA